MKLQTQEVNIVSLVKRCVESFESLAKQKSIELDFKSDKKNIPLYVDQDMIEKILNNLLSNSFKFTAESGRIEIKVTHHSSHISIGVSDTGFGIPPEKLSHIFDRFYQVDDTYVKDQEGTGIGLALTKELVELHHGEIKVVSESGKGTTFTVLLPLGKGHLKEQELDDSRQLTEDSHKLETQNLELKTGNLEPGTRNPELGTRTNVPILLIVEDNADLRHYIRGFLEGAYEILECENGNTGYQKATEIIPDLVISDVMMPEMDGYELCRKLKTDERTSHIPVILLTARADMDSKIEGLETGADDFITKPFDPLELQTRIKNLVKQRIVLQERFNRNIRKLGIEQMMKVDAPDFTSIDQRFFQKAIDLILHHLSESEYNIEILASEMSLSRRQLHRKIVSLTGNSPVRFIRSIRLNRAAEMLAKKTGNVTEIAFEVGFNNLSWFAKSFKEQFGVLPSEYKGDKPEN